MSLDLSCLLFIQAIASSYHFRRLDPSFGSKIFKSLFITFSYHYWWRLSDRVETFKSYGLCRRVEESKIRGIFKRVEEKSPVCRRSYPGNIPFWSQDVMAKCNVNYFSVFLDSFINLRIKTSTSSPHSYKIHALDNALDAGHFISAQILPTTLYCKDMFVT